MEPELVQRLRWVRCVQHAALLAEAADEIEALVRERDALQARTDTYAVRLAMLEAQEYRRRLEASA